MDRDRDSSIGNNILLDQFPLQEFIGIAMVAEQGISDIAEMTLGILRLKAFAFSFLRMISYVYLLKQIFPI